MQCFQCHSEAVMPCNKCEKMLCFTCSISSDHPMMFCAKCSQMICFDCGTSSDHPMMFCFKCNQMICFDCGTSSDHPMMFCFKCNQMLCFDCGISSDHPMMFCFKCNQMLCFDCATSTEAPMFFCQNNECNKMLCFDCGTSSDKPVMICQNIECNKLLCYDCFSDKNQGHYCAGCEMCFCSACAALHCDCENKLDINSVADFQVQKNLHICYECGEVLGAFVHFENSIAVRHIEANDTLYCTNPNCSGEMVRPHSEFTPNLDCPMGCAHKLSHINEAESHCIRDHHCFDIPNVKPQLLAQYHEQWKAFRKARKKKRLPPRPLTDDWRQRCNECGKKEVNELFLVCAGCDANVRKRAYYCSKKCQKANWPKHKKLCPRKDKSLRVKKKKKGSTENQKKS